MPDSVNAAGASCLQSPPKILLSILSLITTITFMQEITRKWPKSRSKLSGNTEDSASTADEHREITAFLKERERSFMLSTLLRSAQKVVIKDYQFPPISTRCDDDLTERGFNVIKVAQLTRTKSKFKLPIFMVELKKLLTFFSWRHACFLSIKIDFL
ncbi:hypothetical protein TNCV_544871 [Trichonephila clavipes]|nr:hypothetical protein TNCV_544871 [Trichonephila clavipes]